MPAPSSIRATLLERTVTWHVVGSVVLITWMFGGMIHWARIPILILGITGMILTSFLLYRSQSNRSRYFIWLSPFAAVNILAIVSAFNPGFAKIVFYGQLSLRPVDFIPFLPSSSIPENTWRKLWLMNGLYLTAFNILIGIRHRRLLRLIAYFILINGTILAIFGTLQKLAGTGLIYGVVRSPNSAFFSTFIYHNHWGAFAVLTTGLGIGLASHTLSTKHSQGFWSGPQFTLIFLVFLLAASVPLSTSRSCTVLMGVLVLVAFFYAVHRVRRYYSTDLRAQTTATVSMISVGIVAVLSVYMLGKPMIDQRIRDTFEQIKGENHYALIDSERKFYGDSRFKLYGDTVDMIKERPIFGWGLGNYSTMFARSNSQASLLKRWPKHYRDAHSDWLEALAEQGIVGTIALFGLIVGPLYHVRKVIFKYPITAFPMLAVASLAAYAFVEFPFANTAVCLTFWVITFLSIRHAMITQVMQSEYK